MKVLILSDANSIHTIRWVKGLSERNVDIGLWSLTSPNHDTYTTLQNVQVFSPQKATTRSNYLTKVRYLSSVSHLKKLLYEFKPDLVHAHYASSYGLIGRLIKFHPFIVSVWGSDVYDFPKKNFLFKNIIKKNLLAADVVLSTSHTMAEETKKYTNKSIEITPFGVDVGMFMPMIPNEKGDDFYIGTVKALEENYGIKYLIEAFALLKKKYCSNDNLKLLIVGKGSLLYELRSLADSLGLRDCCIFTGAVPHDKVSFYHNMMDISIYPSVDVESFGVSAVESSAVGNPVIASKLGGLAEVIDNEITGIHVPPKDVQALAKAMERLYLDKNLRDNFGKNGREKVLELYDWDKNIQNMLNIYQKTVKF